MINLNEVGARPQRDAAGNWQVKFRVYLPNITFNKGYIVKVRLIHEADQFVCGIEPKNFFLNWVNDSERDAWEITVPLIPDPNNHFGQQGTYFYRFQLLHENHDLTFWFADPFGRSTGLGTLSAFVIAPPPFSWTDNDFDVSELDDGLGYELNVGAVHHDFQGVIDSTECTGIDARD